MLILRNQNRILLGLLLLFLLLLVGAATTWYLHEQAPKPAPPGSRLVLRG
jgi:hypothetical protein